MHIPCKIGRSEFHNTCTMENGELKFQNAANTARHENFYLPNLSKCCKCKAKTTTTTAMGYIPQLLQLHLRNSKDKNSSNNCNNNCNDNHNNKQQPRANNQIPTNNNQQPRTNSSLHSYTIQNGRFQPQNVTNSIQNLRRAPNFWFIGIWHFDIPQVGREWSLSSTVNQSHPKIEQGVILFSISKPYIPSMASWWGEEMLKKIQGVQTTCGCCCWSTGPASEESHSGSWRLCKFIRIRGMAQVAILCQIPFLRVVLALLWPYEAIWAITFWVLSSVRKWRKKSFTFTILLMIRWKFPCSYRSGHQDVVGCCIPILLFCLGANWLPSSSALCSDNRHHEAHWDNAQLDLFCFRTNVKKRKQTT